VSTARIWGYSDPAFSADLRGYEVEGLDGRIGTVDQATKDARGGYVVVNSGPRVFRKKVLLPAGVVDRVDHEAKTLYVNRTKAEIKNAPDVSETGYPGSGGAGFRAPAPRHAERGRM
jgi:hypothetical protein